ncbi:MAG: glycoside hydrolase family 97 catalytic domain-containing protein [Xanthomonadales bacterium]|jgi:hypothetical protein|nr:glycoside hydrolase family 97 catalytic domain-containing protein [Xanthomonadales bacterium]
MDMKYIKINMLCILAFLVSPLQADSSWLLNSPGERLAVELELDDEGRLLFQLRRRGEHVIQPSPMGIRFDRTGFENGLSEAGAVERSLVSDDYEMWTGKQSKMHYQANELVIPLVNADRHAMHLRLRLSDDGLAYRYEFPETSSETWTVSAESSGVHFFPGTRAWLQPKANARTGWSNTNPSYEEDYLQDIPIGTPSPTESGWVYPALFRYGEHWILLSETGMDGRYSGSNLAQSSVDGLYRVRFPQAAEVVTGGELMPESTLPFHSPWRLVLAGDLATITDSTLGTDLAEPSRVADTGFIQPGISAWSWGLLKDDFTIYPVQKDFVDYAANMNWPYVLVDADWDQKIGYEKIAELARYAAGRGVSLLLWYNSSGDWNETIYTPKSKLLTRESRRAEFARLQNMGISGVKVDFFAGDGMSVIRYYMDILEDAADFGLVVNTHGSTLPRGLQRTYPNYLTSEAIKGLEFMTFEQANTDREATHSAMLPFARNVFDPMDFTPMVLGDIPDRERKTSNGFQLALPVLFVSGIQHLVTTPQQMAEMPGFVKDYLRDIPARWDESRLIDGYPGRFAVIARRAGERWFVAGINAEPETRKLAMDLNFTGAVEGRLISDGANWRQPALSEFNVDQAEVTLPHGTGFVMILEP